MENVKRISKLKWIYIKIVLIFSHITIWLWNILKIVFNLVYPHSYIPKYTSNRRDDGRYQSGILAEIWIERIILRVFHMRYEASILCGMLRNLYPLAPWYSDGRSRIFISAQQKALHLEKGGIGSHNDHASASGLCRTLYRSNEFPMGTKLTGVTVRIKALNPSEFMLNLNSCSFSPRNGRNCSGTRRVSSESWPFAPHCLSQFPKKRVRLYTTYIQIQLDKYPLPRVPFLWSCCTLFISHVFFSFFFGYQASTYTDFLSKLHYDRRSVGQSVLVPGTHLGPATNFSSSLFDYF
jgi:hypothetical protein